MDEMNREILEHMLKEIDFAIKEADGLTEADFMGDDSAQHAIVMALLNIGELANSLGFDFYTAHAQIPWRKIIDMRNAAAHGYFALKLPLIWQTVRVDLPELREALRAILG